MRIANRKVIYYISLVLFFFSTYIFLLPDSVQYYDYLDFFEGIRPLEQWNPDRGFVFPFILWMGTMITSNVLGILVIFSVIYIFSFVYIIKTLQLILKYENVEISDAYVYICVFIVLGINPIIYSCYHVVLTDFVSAFWVIIQFYVSTKFLLYRITDRKYEKHKYFLYCIISCILIILEYFTKQMYFPISLVIVLFYEIFYVIKRKEIKNFIYSAILLVAMLFALVGSVKIFGQVTDSSKKQDSFAIIAGGLRYFEVEGYEHKDGDIRISHYYQGKRKVYIKDDNEENIDEFVYNFDGSFGNTVKFVFLCLKKNPQRFFQGYYDNYMLLSGFYSRPWEHDYIQYQTGRVVRHDILKNLYDIGTPEIKNLSQEIKTSFIPYILIENVDTQWLVTGWGKNGWSFWNDRVLNYREIGGSLVGKILGKSFFYSISMSLWAVLITISPLRFVFYIYKYCKKREKSIYYSAQAVLNVFCTSQIVFFSITGCVVDRYLLAGYMAVLISFMLFILCAGVRFLCCREWVKRIRV